MQFSRPNSFRLDEPRPVPEPETDKREVPTGILQKPLGWWKFGVGVQIHGGFAAGGASEVPDAYDAVKQDYADNPNKYWEGVVGLSPDLFMETEQPHNFSNLARFNVRAFIDLGQIRLGHEFSPIYQKEAVLMRLSRDSWGSDETTAACFQIDTRQQNIFFAGLNLANFVEEADKLLGPPDDVHAIWISYALDRHNFTIENEVHEEVDVPGGRNYSRKIYEEDHGSGTGIGHRILLEGEITKPLTGRVRKTDPRLTFSVRAGIDFGKLSSGSWSTNYAQFVFQLGVGFYFGVNRRETSWKEGLDRFLPTIPE